MAEDAIALLKSDHRQVKELFDDYEELTPRAVKKAIQLRDRIVRELSIHAAIEERVLYPVVIELVPDLEDMILEGMQEHAVAEQLLAQVAAMTPEDRWFKPKMSVLAENVRHHIKEEEREIFPKLRSELTKTQLVDLGEALRQERKTAPTVPPPAAQARALLENVTDRAQAVLHSVTALAG